MIIDERPLCRLFLAWKQKEPLVVVASFRVCITLLPSASWILQEDTGNKVMNVIPVHGDI